MRLRLQPLCQPQSIVNGGEKLVLVKWFGEKRYGTNLHRGDARSHVIAASDDNHPCPRRQRAEPRQHPRRMTLWGGRPGGGGGVGGRGSGGSGGAALARGRSGAGVGGGVGGQRRAAAGTGVAVCRAQHELTRYAPWGGRAMVSRS